MPKQIRTIATDDGERIVAAIDAVDAVDARAAGRPRIALVHSLAMDHRFWDPVVDRLAGRADVVRIDARGHGASSKPAGPYRVARMAADLRDVVDALGWTSVVVAGASMGGCVALQFASDHADVTAGLGLFDTTAWYGPTAPRDWDERAAKARAEGLAALVGFQKTRWFGDAFRASHPDVVDAAVATFLANDLEAYAATCAMLGAFDGRALTGAIRAPTRVLVGDEDYAAPPAMAEALHRAIAGSTCRVLPGARHLTPLEAPDVVADELLALCGSADEVRP